MDVLLSHRGYLLMFDNWHNAGVGKVVAIYQPTGELVRSYELEALYPAKQLETIPTSVSSRWWRCRPFGFFDPDEQTQYLPLIILVVRSPLTSLLEHMSTDHGGRSAIRSEPVETLVWIEYCS